MNKTTKILAIVIASIIVIGGAFGFYYIKAYSNSFNRLAIAMEKSMNAKSQDTSVRVSLKLEPEKYAETMGYELTEEEKGMMEYVNSLLDKAVLQGNIKQEINKKNPMDSKMQYSIGLLYDSDVLLDVMLGMNKEDIELFIPSLINKTFFSTKNDIYEKIGIDLEDFNFEKYYKIYKGNDKLLKKVDKAAYMDIFKDNIEKRIEKGDSIKVLLDNGDEVKCREFILKLKYKDIVNLLWDIKEELEDDRNFCEYLRVTILEIMEELYDSKDYQAFNIERVEIKDALDYLEDKNDFEDAYDEIMASLDEIIMEIENVSEEIEFDYNITYAIDRSNTIRLVGMDMDYDFMSINYKYIINSLDKKIKFAEFKDNERINIMELADQGDEELYEMFEDIIVDAGETLISNKALESLIRDGKANSNLLPSWYRGYIESMLGEFENNKETFIMDIIENLKYELGYYFY